MMTNRILLTLLFPVTLAIGACSNAGTGGSGRGGRASEVGHGFPTSKPLTGSVRSWSIGPPARTGADRIVCSHGDGNRREDDDAELELERGELVERPLGSRAPHESVSWAAYPTPCTVWM